MTPFQYDLYLRAERLCVLHRSRMSDIERSSRFPMEHIEDLYLKLCAEVNAGSSTEEAHAKVRAWIMKKHKGKDSDETGLFDVQLPPLREPPIDRRPVPPRRSFGYVDTLRMRWHQRYRQHIKSGPRFRRAFTSLLLSNLHWRIRLAAPMRRKQVRMTLPVIQEAVGYGWVKSRLRAQQCRRRPSQPAGYKQLPRVYSRADVTKLVRKRLFNQAQPEGGWDRSERKLAGRRATCERR